jgi:hypothetical protein
MKDFKITYFNIIHFLAGIAVGYLIFQSLLG